MTQKAISQPRYRMLNLVPTLTSVLLLALLIGGSAEKAQAQGGRKNLAAVDTKAYHFGFALSGNRSDFNLIHHADFTFSDSLIGIANAPQAGFNLALIASWNMTPNVHLRFLPGLSFQDRALEYRFLETDGQELIVKRTESVFLDFPLILKLRTDRIGNCAAFALIGGKISKDMQSQEEVNQQLQNDFILRLESSNASVDIGAGIDFFLPFFKFSIEGKFELGTRNVLIQDESLYSSPIDALRTRSFIFSLCFEG